MKKNKKIAVICNYHLLPDRVGGMDRFFWLFDTACKSLGHEVIWFFPNAAHHGNYDNLTIIPANDNSLESIFISYSKQNLSQFDVVITHFLELCTSFFKKVKKQQASKTIAVDHNPRPLQGYALKKKIIKRIKGILYARYTDVFVCVSKYSISELISEFGNPIQKKTIVIFNGLEIHKFKKKSQFNSNKHFITASHLREDKGIQDLILAVALLKKDMDINFIIDIYGDGYYEATLKNMVQEFSLQNIFIFKGNVANLHELYCNYDYLIHPSHGETFCYSVVESLLSNLPVITTKNYGNVLGLVENNTNGFLYEVSEIDQLKEILFKISIQEYAINDFSSNNEKVKDLSLENMVRQYLKLIDY
ncbi:glycosyltransferase family 4 protein [Flavobacterium sp.]|uniref:glycosyltransferase family 4 protein n=1 Tax=Flavobacterium sp. TaxID=239 RepID=UPI002B4B8867|nr:glycosyltransferase family 4 protein [Flavobacterium sp.]HLF51236.1 glycosyltransferase family 4 protein [Flavobacterium sp.]